MRTPNPALDPAAAKAAWKASTQAPPPDTELRLSCTLVTPLYGGGVKAGEVDRALPIRVCALRGQWRFWWRMVAGPFESSRQMFERETAIWGGIAADGPTASRVAVQLLDHTPVNLEPAHKYDPDLAHPGKLKSFPQKETYALFPAQGKLAPDRTRIDPQDPPKALVKPGLRFRLAVRFAPGLSDEQRREVRTALRWWACFGGVGARTRRGLGAVRVEGLEPVSAQEVEKAGGRLVLLGAMSDPVKAWKDAVDRLKAFRQEKGIGRNPSAPGSRSSAGRSLWPEADTLRHLSHRAASHHRERLVAVDGFPRAAFGLPIVFHFKDAQDPDDHVLEPADESCDLPRERMASPLILRPYPDAGGWRPAALLLPGWEAALTQPLKFKDHNYHPVPWPADPAERKRVAGQVRPLKDRGDDALSAFMRFFAQGGK